VPIYTYRALKGGCSKCKPGFEQKQSMSDDPLKKCPECGAAVERQIQPVSVVHKTADLLSTSNLRQKGFRKFVKSKAAGGYREET
jgi:putative FmdB family regulatory protein